MFLVNHILLCLRQEALRCIRVQQWFLVCQTNEILNLVQIKHTVIVWEHVTVNKTNTK